MTYREYIKYKLRLKLNLIVSGGKSESGIINEALIDRFSSYVDEEDGYYEIVYDQSIFPIEIIKLIGDVRSVGRDKSMYAIFRKGDITGLLDKYRVVKFTLREFRDLNIKLILNE